VSYSLDPWPCRLAKDTQKDGRFTSAARLDPSVCQSSTHGRLARQGPHTFPRTCEVRVPISKTCGRMRDIPPLDLHLIRATIQTDGIVSVVEIHSSEYRHGLSDKAREWEVQTVRRHGLRNSCSATLAHSILAVSPAVLSKLPNRNLVNARHQPHATKKPC
jgi:hypothetical protein